MFGTVYGDGYYYDQMGNGYPVDSGSIGCVLFDKIDEDIDEEYLKRSGKVLDITESFEVESEDGTIFIGPVTIYTGDEEEDQCWDCGESVVWCTCNEEEE
jgi:hypothetical protein